MLSKLFFKRSLVIAAVAAMTSQAQVMPAPGKDPALLNEARVSYWLSKRLERDKKSPKQLEQAVAQYKKRARIQVIPPEILKAANAAIARRDAKVARGELAKSSFATKTVKVLTVLIDFPDLPHDENRLTPQDTDMYYTDYTVEHYNAMLFAQNGYTGPHGESLKTVYQYYQGESNNQFFYTGNAYDWVTANNNSDFYGANDPDNNDSDKNPQDLVKEAVEKAVNQYAIDLTEYDLEDPYDLDNDGILNEADGFIDHVQVFHSSIGEEAGGGVLGDNAIWSHRYYVNWSNSFANSGYEIPGTGKRVFGYTIQPIDSAIGVVAHEFGHDLGLKDEYDTNNSGAGSPVGNWSIMAGGSWAGSLAGSEPTTFSPYARDELTRRHGVNFAVQQELDISELSETPTQLNLVDATDHSAVNQIKLHIPGPAIDIGAPWEGEWQYHSGRGDNLNNRMSRSLNVPAGTNVTLKMRARYDIEKDWDYAQVMINDTALAGNLTSAANPLAGNYPQYAGVVNYLTGVSKDIANADADGWVELVFDVSAWQGQSVALSFNYVTDSNTGGWGILLDNLVIEADGNLSWSDDAETADTMTFGGYARIGSSYEGIKRAYYLQLRSPRNNDSGLASRGYEPGVLLWLGDDNFADNKVSDHPGEGFIGVVDADQVLIGDRGTSTQVRDAAFSLYDQSAFSGDDHLTANGRFDDSNDYSAPAKPESGRKLPTLGLQMEVLNQAADSSSAQIQLIVTEPTTVAAFSTQLSERTLTLTNSSRAPDGATYQWDFGDASGSTEFAPTHQYAADGTYSVTLTVTDSGSQQSDTASVQVVIDTAPVADFSLTRNEKTITLVNNSSGGIGGLTYEWDFGDGTTSTETAPTHTYTSDGTYTVTLTVRDGENRSVSASQSVTVSTPPPPPSTNDGGSSSSGGGGSLSWILLLALGGLYRRRV